MRRQRAFTLIEILTVVAILAILMALLFPTFTRVKVAIRRGRCLSNLHQLGVALHDYAVASASRLPAVNPPWGAYTPADATKVLNPFLSGQGYKVLECPGDSGDVGNYETTKYEQQGYSYWYVTSTGQGLSTVVGAVNWQEEPMGGMSLPTNLRAFYNYTCYDSPGPEDGAEYQTRARDVTRAEIDDYWYNTFVPWAASYRGREAFEIPTGLTFKFVVYRGQFDGYDANGNAKYKKWEDEVLPPDGYGRVYHVPFGDPTHESGKWSPQTNGFSRSAYNYDYWRNASKKVAILDWDATLAYATPAAGQAYPTNGKGFWHQYPYTNMGQGDPAKYYVRCHACFLDGHAAAIEMNKYTTIDRDGHEYY